MKMPYRMVLLSAAGAGLALLLLFAGLNPDSAAGQAQLAQSAPQFRSAQNPDQPDEIEISIDEEVASGFESPVQVTHAGDGSGRLFVVEQTGRIKIIQNGVVLATPFLNLNSRISCCGERGLLGLAFHPYYEYNGYFYVDYTRSGDGATVVARYSVTSDPNVADFDSEFKIITIPQTNTNHNGGQLAFGPLDGKLYIGMGDGGGAGDPFNVAQNIDSLLGKILRLDVDGGSPYAIPPDNPFVGRDGRDEIWALGLRNPWRYSFDRQNGDLYIGDVGQNGWEEISFQAAGTPGGVNFGWRCKEGSHEYIFTGDCLTAELTDPIAEYSHSVGLSVTGGFVYRGSVFSALQGHYFFADYVNGKIWSLYQTSQDPIQWSAPELELDTPYNISSFGEDEAGELYVVLYSGAIRRLTDANGPSPNLSTSRKLVSSRSANPLEVVTYTIQIINTGGLVDAPILLTDTLPNGLSYVPESLQASSGSWSDDDAPTLTWQASLNQSDRFTITYRASATGLITGSLINQAEVSALPYTSFSLLGSLAVPRSVVNTTIEDFRLPGTQPGQLNANITLSIDCDTCHNQPIYDRWRGSMMSQAGRDPLLWAALAVAEIDAPNAGEYCLRCHTPKGWLEGRSQPSDGSALQLDDLGNGVACAVCHRQVDPRPSAGDETAVFDDDIRSGLTAPVPQDFTGSAAMVVDPQDRRRGPFSFSPSLPFHAAYRSNFLGQTGSAETRARMCGTCHNVSNPVLSWDEGRGQYWPNSMDTPAPEVDQEKLFPIETTFEEWLHSDFASGGVFDQSFSGEKADGVVETCQDCHMPRRTGTAADPAFNPQLRDCQPGNCLPEHTLVGANTWALELLQNPGWRLSVPLNERSYLQAAIYETEQMLSRSAEITATLSSAGSNALATVRVTNNSGHKLPTGYPEGRQIWINLRAYNINGSLIYESGAYDHAAGQLIRDSAIKVYEAKQGLTPELADFLNLPTGESFHFVLNNTVIKDNRIPPRGVTQAEYDRPGLRPVGAVYADGQYWDETTYTLPGEAVRVIASLYYQTSSKEYINFLRQNGGVDGYSLGLLWDDSKSPPKLMAQVMFPANTYYLPLIHR